MSELLPTRSSVNHDPVESRVVTLNENEQEIFAALHSKTAREIVALLYDKPMTPSELASRLDTSIQNVSHHLANLREIDLVAVVDSWYSEKGREMDVYATTTESLVVTIK